MNPDAVAVPFAPTHLDHPQNQPAQPVAVVLLVNRDNITYPDSGWPMADHGVIQP
ncbi:hypothetical protein [Micromonospora sp. NPDC049171]|uniref:hypothetical protein n=1 Tax=Micromonospora sp. NPDC049171 TaxID=3155770 RepID=UPI0033CE3E18